MCGVSDDRGIVLILLRWLYGGCMVGLLVVLFVPLLLSFSLGNARPLLLSRCNTCFQST